MNSFYLPAIQIKDEETKILYSQKSVGMKKQSAWSCIHLLHVGSKSTMPISDNSFQLVKWCSSVSDSLKFLEDAL